MDGFVDTLKISSQIFLYLNKAILFGKCLLPNTRKILETSHLGHSRKLSSSMLIKQPACFCVFKEVLHFKHFSFKISLETSLQDLLYVLRWVLLNLSRI